MLIINTIHPFHRDIWILQWCDVCLWHPLDSNCKTYHDSISLKLRNMLLLPPIYYSFIFLSPLVLADFDTLNYIFWYISDSVVFSSFNIFSMVLVIVYWFCQCFMNMLIFIFFWFSIFVSSVDIGIIWFLELAYVFIPYLGQGLCLPLSLYLMWC